jgi:hypothetical protein
MFSRVCVRGWAPAVGAVVVVEAEVGLELALQAGAAGEDVASERGVPALVEDRQVQIDAMFLTRAGVVPEMDYLS